MKLTEHFSLEELTFTQVRGVDNAPSEDVLANLIALALKMERVRSILGNLPIQVNSGYRCPTVNSAVGGSKSSAHMMGHAADFICPRFGTPLEVVRKLDASGVRFDQLIQEGGDWVHISIDPRMRREVLTARFVIDEATGKKRTTYTNGA